MLQIFLLSASILFWQHQPGMSQETLEGLFHSNLESCTQVMVIKRIALLMSGMLRLIDVLSWCRDQWWASVLKEASWEGSSNHLLVISILLCVLVSGIICSAWSCFMWFWSTIDLRKSWTGVSDWFYTLSESGNTKSYVCLFHVLFWRSSMDFYVDEEINILL